MRISYPKLKKKIKFRLLVQSHNNFGKALLFLYLLTDCVGIKWKVLALSLLQLLLVLSGKIDFYDPFLKFEAIEIANCTFGDVDVGVGAEGVLFGLALAGFLLLLDDFKDRPD